MEHSQSPYEIPNNVQGGAEANPPMGGNGSEYAPTLRGLESLANPIDKDRSSRVEASVAGAPPIAPVLPAPIVAPSQVPSPLPVQDDNSMPIVANDDDLIEKEWVDKAKSIIAATQDDPYKREQEVKRLQIEYVRKRYGREIGDGSKVE